ncbi:L-threonylcarbamoyladenylate synthase [Wenyingzhuangia sp. 2_MG-2023]|uniref:L-threonylcarbamoyladenylate synthase n=1 Tax=Wenyingzhuangia sp. 2_MG-2023 TaxID=3062639 RepID=UPI0026E3E477|nr:L-threonylcarbamoyladenylate synthase [Wenyingzhuangia sp. 2_MG-2023]MDO6738424.1 L-threonylcarbamoyladenylate synthase [Wenyingzhuangia sp. 2_MG-2023]MDO6803353.1 L-threonylcarbamoyladenylate synthase [Wenyingzhuangia sp. 1_MG-2023]
MFSIENKTILYPTDTVWGIGCDATDEKLVAKIYEIKQREETKSLVILVDSLEMLQKYIQNVPSKALDILSQVTQPTTIVYEHPMGLAKNAVGKDNTIAIRIASDDFCKKMIADFGKPIVSTSANISGDPTPKQFSEINPAILQAVDYVVNLHHDKICEKSSTILKITNQNQVTVIRA